MDSVAIWLSSAENSERIEQIERRRVRDKSNIMEFSDKSFVKNYRLSKDAIMYLLNQISPHQILNVCCVLHNLCLKFRVELPDPTQEQEEALQEDANLFSLAQYSLENEEYSNLAKRIRNNIRNDLLNS